MDDPISKKTSAGTWLHRAILLVVLSPWLYILSSGPAAFLVVRLDMGWEAARVFYLPVMWIRDNTLLKKPLGWYMHEWEKSADYYSSKYRDSVLGVSWADRSKYYWRDRGKR